MSGPHAQFRTPTRPLTQEVEIDNPAFEEGGDEPEKIKTEVPVLATDKNGELKLKLTPVAYTDEETGEEKVRSELRPYIRHVLDFRFFASPPGKHAKGRAKKTNREHRVGARDQLRAVQARKSAAEDAKRLG